MEITLETLKQLAIEAARENFLAYVRYMAPLVLNAPYVDGAHIELICEHLQAVEAGELDRLQIWMPPRSMKSWLGSMLFPTWCIGRHPNWDFMQISYQADLATDFSREVKNMIQMEEYLEVFPGIALRQDSKAAHRWQTTGKGHYVVGSITAGIAGKGAMIALVDDPLSEQDAMSVAERKRVHRWYPSGLRSRLAPGGRIILISTRWHLEDLCGWLIERAKDDELMDQWTILKIPAIIDEEASKILGLPVGSSYWPQRWSLESLLKTKANDPLFNALYMQDPVIEGGNIIKREYIKDWIKAKPPGCDYILMSLDTAYSTKETADFSAITVWGIFYQVEDLGEGYGEQQTPHMILLSCKQGRWAFNELLETTKLVWRDYNADGIIIEDKASGQSLIQELRRAGMPIIAYKPDRDKLSRAHACTPVLQAGRVWMPLKRQWTRDIMDQAVAFPNAAHDDLVDTMTQAILWMRDAYKLKGPSDAWWREKEQKPYEPKTYWSVLTQVA